MVEPLVESVLQQPTRVRNFCKFCRTCIPVPEVQGVLSDCGTIIPGVRAYLCRNTRGTGTGSCFTPGMPAMLHTMTHVLSVPHRARKYTHRPTLFLSPHTDISVPAQREHELCRSSRGG